MNVEILVRLLGIAGVAAVCAQFEPWRTAAWFVVLVLLLGCMTLAHVLYNDGEGWCPTCLYTHAVHILCCHKLKISPCLVEDCNL